MILSARRSLTIVFGIALFAVPTFQNFSQARETFSGVSSKSKISYQLLTRIPDVDRRDAIRARDQKRESASHRLLKSGLHPKASDALRKLNIPAYRIIQTVGNAPASNGVHLPDGSANGHPYTAAVDISTKNLDNSEIKRTLERLGRVGFAAFFRNPGQDGWPSNEAQHIHAVYAGVPMKDVLDSQVRDYLNQRNGLRSHTPYQFYIWSDKAKSEVRSLFSASN
jgi:hypothetical protein